jgi:ABC-2 type transport system ATP-binding protein
MSKLIEINNVSKAYGKNKILSNVSTSFSQGEFIGLVGISGSGKTTLLKCLLGLTPYKGKILFHGKNIKQQMADFRSRIGYCCQGNSFYNELSVKENLEYFRSFYSKKGMKNINWLIDFLDLRSSINTIARKLSGGMKRRLDLGCALVGNPEMVLLDEPFSGLDPLRRTNICSLLKKINNLGKTILISTHDLGLIQNLCSRVIVLKAGTFVEDLSIESLIDKYSFVFEIDLSIKHFDTSSYQDLANDLNSEGYEMLGFVTSEDGVKIYVKEYKKFLIVLSKLISYKNLVLNRFFIKKPDFSEVFKVIFLEELEATTSVISTSENIVSESDFKDLLASNRPEVVFQCLNQAGVDPLFVAKMIKEMKK